MNPLFKAALVVLAATAGTAFAATTANQEITGNVASGYAIGVSGGTSITLTPGSTSTTTSTLTVNATGAYVVTAETDKANMTEHDGSNYVSTTPKTLQATPTLSTSAAFGTDTTDVALAPDGTSTGLTVFSGTEAVDSGSVTTTFSQPVAYDDVVLSTTNYKIVITYTIAPAV